jgi:hypothetical protein
MCIQKLQHAPAINSTCLTRSMLFAYCITCGVLTRRLGCLTDSVALYVQETTAASAGLHAMKLQSAFKYSDRHFMTCRMT